MKQKFKNIIVSLLLSIFLIPTFIKLEHHHEHHYNPSECSQKNQQKSPKLEEKCAVCNFEFSIFVTQSAIAVSKKIELFDGYVERYRSHNISNFSKYSFSLRAPPIPLI